MKLSLSVKKIDIRVGDAAIAVIRSDTAHRMDLHPGDRVLISYKKKKIVALLEVSEDGLKKDSIGLYQETYAQLGCHRSATVTLEFAPAPHSLAMIKSKLTGSSLDRKSIDQIVEDIIHDRLSLSELSYFVAACEVHDLSDEEVADLTRSLVTHGKKMNFKSKMILDKHCVGGVPNNRTSMIVIPIISLLGLTIPKISSRVFESSSGTVDTMEVLCNVTHDSAHLKKIVEKVHGFLVNGDALQLISVDDVLHRVRHALSLDPEGIMIASILSKKMAVGAHHVVIEIPVGSEAKITTMKHAQHLKKRFMKIAKMLHMHVKVIISDGDQPVGNGVGPILEALDVMKILKNEADAPQDLKESAITLAGALIDISGKFWWKKGPTVAKQIIESGKAYEQIQKIIAAQGAKKKALRPGKHVHDVCATHAGKIKTLSNHAVSKVARVAGAPRDTAAGVYLHKKVGDSVKKGDVLFTLYASDAEHLDFALTCAHAHALYSY